MSMTVKDLLKMGEARLTQAGCMDPRIDAEALFCYIMHMTKMQLFMSWPMVMNDEQCDHYFNILDVRASGRPLQYIIGTAEFMGMSFKVDENVLIPRQDTETLVETAINTIRENYGKGKVRILDLCTGSGAIAVSLERFLSEGRSVKLIEGGSGQPVAHVDVAVTASDISAPALAIAKANAASNKAKIDFVLGDLFNPFKRKIGGAKKFDYIVSNPPYIPTAVIDTLQVEVRDHEPRLALDGGLDGLDCYRRLIEEAPAHLREGGTLIMEIGHDQAASIRELATNFASVEIITDLAGHDRVALLKL